MTAATTPVVGHDGAQRLCLRDLHKTYRSRKAAAFEAVKGINLEVEPGELVALLGPSGCGKTTTLRMIAGLETVTSGDILVGERTVSRMPPGQRNIGLGFESYALYPPLSVRENLAFGLKARKVPDVAQRVERIAERFGMDDLLNLRPSALSSGEKQRVAMARALIGNPPVLLLDEPLSHLDLGQRESVRRELRLLQREFGYTTIVVTHDQLEALSLADRIAVMDAGVIQQFGTPDEIYDDPANRFVADFVGEPRMNLIAGSVARAGAGRLRARIGDAGSLAVTAREPHDGAEVIIGVRPQDSVLLERDAGEGVTVHVRAFEDLMEYGLAHVEAHGAEEPIVVQTESGLGLAAGDELTLQLDPARVYLFDPETGERLR